MEGIIVVLLLSLGTWLTTREIMQGQIRKAQLANERRRDELASGFAGQIQSEDVIKGVAAGIRDMAVYSRYGR